MKSSFYRILLCLGVALVATKSNMASADLTFGYSGYGYDFTINPELGLGNRPSYAMSTSNGNANFGSAAFNTTFSGTATGTLNYLAGGSSAPPTYTVPTEYAGSTGSITVAHTLGTDSLTASFVRNGLRTSTDYGAQDTSTNANGYTYFAFSPTATALYKVDLSVREQFSQTNPNSNAYFYSGGDGNVALRNATDNVSLASIGSPYQNLGLIGTPIDQTYAFSNEFSLVAGKTYELVFGGQSYAGGGGVGFTNTTTHTQLASITAVAVPEPGSLALFGLATVGSALRYRKRKKAAGVVTA
jgi:hypothetical protein